MYYDLLVQIKNAQSAGKKTIRLPYSNMDFAVAKILADSGYIKGTKKKAVDKKNFLDIELLSRMHKNAVKGFRFFSKPGRRFYIGYRDLVSVRQGHGLGVLSTPQGILSAREAKKKKMGGEYLFQIW